MYLSQHTSHGVACSPLFFNACVCVYYIHEGYFPSQPPSTPTHYHPLSQPIYETNAHLEDGKRSANTNMKPNSVSNSHLECGFWSRQKHIRSRVKTGRSAFDWLNIVSKSANDKQRKNTTMKSNGASNMIWIAVLEACKASSGQHVACSQ